MNTRFEHHGEYLRDYFSRGHVGSGTPVEYDVAIDLLRGSAHVQENDVPLEADGRNILMNKGFCVLGPVGTRCLIVTNYDGRFHLYVGDKLFFYGLLKLKDE